MKDIVISKPASGPCDGPIHLESDGSGRVHRAVCLSCGLQIDRDLAEALHEMLEDRATSAEPNHESPLA